MNTALTRLALRVGFSLVVVVVGHWYLDNQFNEVTSQLRKGTPNSSSPWATAEQAQTEPYSYTGPIVDGVTGKGYSGQTYNNSRPREIDGRYMSPESRAEAAGWGSGQTLSGNAPVIDERDR